MPKNHKKKHQGNGGRQVLNYRSYFAPHRPPPPPQSPTHGVYHMDKYRQLTTEALADRREGELCMTYVRRADDTSWYSKQQITEQSKQFRDERKSGLITMMESNNGTIKLENKTFYYFVVQHTDPECDMIDPLAMANGLMVSGFVYYFTNQHNRDALYKYIMGLK